MSEKTWGENREVGKEILNLERDLEGEAAGKLSGSDFEAKMWVGLAGKRGF